MINTVLGFKKAVTQTFVDGRRVFVTKLQCKPSTVTQIKTLNNDGYWAIQLGFGEKRIKNTTKPLQGHLKKANVTPKQIQEVRFQSRPEEKVGDKVSFEGLLSTGDLISVSAMSKGKGFASGIKLFNFRGGPRTHGQSDRERAPGSLGQTTTPGRVYKGKKMAARMGWNKVTVKNLKVISVNPETYEVVVSGAVPGIVNGLVTIKKLN